MTKRNKPAPTTAPNEVFLSAGATVLDTPLSDEVETSYLEYAYSVIHSRALPDVRDGLKPVHRRILYAMHKMGLRHTAPQVKAARVVGEVLGRYHPHGDSSVYDAMVRLAQDFSMNMPMVDGHGNWGSVNDGAAAMRYTECRLASPSTMLVGELGENTVDFVPNYDGSLEEPSVLPCAFPNLLVNGSSGIAVGMSTLILPHNVTEVLTAARALLNNTRMRDSDLRALIPGPDFPTGGVIQPSSELETLFTEGKAVVKLRAKVAVEKVPRSRSRVRFVFTELPYQVGTEKIVEAFHRAIEKKTITGVADVKDLSDREAGVRLVVECKTGVDPDEVLASIFHRTPLEVSFTANNIALVDGAPRTVGTRELLNQWLTFRLETIRRRTEHRLTRAQGRLHIVEGLLTALANVDEVVATIKKSRSADTARKALRRTFGFSAEQCDHILSLKLRSLVTMEKGALRAERSTLKATVRDLQKVLRSKVQLRRVLDQELSELLSAYTTPRRTTLL